MSPPDVALVSTMTSCPAAMPSVPLLAVAVVAVTSPEVAIIEMFWLAVVLVAVTLAPPVMVTLPDVAAVVVASMLFDAVIWVLPAPRVRFPVTSPPCAFRVTLPARLSMRT